MKKIITLFLVAIASINCAIAQRLNYEQYMNNVLKNNTEVLAREMNIDISEANIKSSRIYNDPTLSIEYGNNEDWDKKLGQSIAAQLSRTFTFGVRKAGINLAEKEHNASINIFLDYIRNFHAEATIAYLEHLKTKALLHNAEKREDYMLQIAKSDSIRFAKGDVAKAVWIESRLAAGLVHNETVATLADYNNSKVVLGYFMGNMKNTKNITTDENLAETTSEKPQPLEVYIETALNNRADLFAAVGKRDIAEAQNKLNSARRRIDIQLSIGAEYNKGAHRNDPAEPSFTKLKIGASVPLKFSNLNKGARTKEKIKLMQAEQELTDTRLTIQSEVMQAYNNYMATEEQVNTFSREMLNEVAELLESKRKAYRKGEISFIEFIETERSENIMQTAYIEALFNKAKQWTELQKSIGNNTNRR